MTHLLLLLLQLLDRHLCLVRPDRWVVWACVSVGRSRQPRRVGTLSVCACCTPTPTPSHRLSTCTVANRHDTQWHNPRAQRLALRRSTRPSVTRPSGRRIAAMDIERERARPTSCGFALPPRFARTTNHQLTRLHTLPHSALQPQTTRTRHTCTQQEKVHTQRRRREGAARLRCSHGCSVPSSKRVV